MRNSLNEEIKQLLYPIFNQQANTLQDAIKVDLKRELDTL